MALLLSSLSMASPDEGGGIVTKVIDGDTFEVQGFGTVRLADVDSPEVGSAGYSEASEYAANTLQGRPVYLDVDDELRTDRDGRYVCVAYLTNPNGTVNVALNFNRMLVDAGHACVKDYPENEFNPADWWEGCIPAPVCTEDASSTPDTDQPSVPEVSPVPPAPAIPVEEFEGFESSVNRAGSASTGAFVGSVQSDKYHYPDCRWAQKILPENEIWFSSPVEARAEGYTACAVCRPP